MPRALPFALALALAALATPARSQGPPTVEEERAALRLADPALAVTLVAAEPEVVSPVAFAWDADGFLYVAEMTDYPKDPSGGRVKRLEDRDGDGRYESATVFAEKLPFPNGVLPWGGGLLVTAAPDLLFLKDTDGDGRADLRRVVLTGFGEGNQQLRVNSPTWGLDNRVYLANGRSGGAVRRPDQPAGAATPLPRNDLRLDPATGAFEPVAGFSQFGLPRDDWGDRFPSWNTVPLRHVVLEARESGGTPGVADILDLGDGGRVFSLAPAQRRFNAETVAYFNATCGPTIYRGPMLGPDYAGHAFVCEPLTSLVHHRRLDPAGPTYLARRVEAGREFLASAHPWFRPVNLGTGPDGALYVADFCRAWVEHPDFVPEAQRQAVDFREGHASGRIWRIAPRAAPGRVAFDAPGKASTPGLVALLGHPNGWQRDTAQRLLVERNDPAAGASLRDLAKSAPSPLTRTLALRTLDGLRALGADTLRAALGSESPRLREQAVRLTEGREAAHGPALAALADDPDERVRLRVAVALAALDSAEAREALARLAARDVDSPWLSAAALAGVGRSPSAFLETLGARQPAWLNGPSEAQATFLNRLAADAAARHAPAEAGRLAVLALACPGEAAAFALLEGLARGPRRDGSLPVGEPWERLARTAHAAALDPARPAWVRTRALELLLTARPADARDLVLPCLEADQPPALQRAAARGSARAAGPDGLVTLFERWDRYALGTRKVVLGSLTETPALAARLLEAVSEGKVPAAEIDPATRDALLSRNDPKLKALVASVLGSGPDANRREVVARYGPALSLTGVAQRGGTLFEQHCQACHTRGGPGAKVGPDLLSVAGRPAADLLVAILDPSREAAPDGLGVIVSTTRGQTFSGLLVAETPTETRLRRAGGLEDAIPRDEVEAVRPTGRSLMPDGLEAVLSPQDVADLVAFLRSTGPVP